MNVYFRGLKLGLFKYVVYVWILWFLLIIFGLLIIVVVFLGVVYL